MSSRVEAVRSFNRFYTKQIGVLREGLLESPFSLTEVRVLYELSQAGDLTATALARQLEIDQGYLSRILTGFEKRGLLTKSPSPTDGRQMLLNLTDTARAQFEELNRKSDEEVEAMLNHLSNSEQTRLLDAMRQIRSLFAEGEENASFLLRPHRPGDMGWIVYRHGVLYSGEHGYDERFEALVAEIVAKFLKEFDPKRENCWIAERDGEIVGSVLLVRESDEVAKLRLLLVEPSARGLGIGGRLVDECVRFARRAGYAKISLWTHRDLVSARRIYQKAGFRLVRELAHRDFGDEQIAETWEMDL